MKPKEPEQKQSLDRTRDKSGQVTRDILPFDYAQDLRQNCWYAKDIPTILGELNAVDYGLTSEEAKARLDKYGPNKLPEPKVDSIFKIFLKQFQSPLIYILFLASAIIFFLGEYVDGFVILFVLLFNAVVGSIQEGKSQNTILALRKFTETNATVLRDKREIIITDSEIVPGDILILREGDKVPADARIISTNNLKVDEASLTGESLPVFKIADVLKNEDLITADQKNMLFKGTYVVAGNARAVAVATGLETVIGKISKKIAMIDTEIPLKKNIRNLSKLIIIVVLAVSIILFFSGLFLDKSVKEMFTTVVSLAVSVIPEGLPIVITLVLATGVFRMSRRNALVKKLQAVESLGQTSIIAVDKTGTLTKNELVIQKIFVDGKYFDVTGTGYENKGNIIFENKIIDPLNHPELLFAGRVAAFCANARTMYNSEEKSWKVHGDPTEACMFVLGNKIGFNKDELEAESPLISEIPFDYQNKYHVMVHKINSASLMTVTGAPEVILGLSQSVWHNGKNINISEKERKELEEVFVNMSKKGLRVVGFAVTNRIPNNLIPVNIKDLVFGGYFGIKDALRPEVKDSIARAKGAGIRVIMITGDHKITAEAVAAEAGIFEKGTLVLTGSELDQMNDKELSISLAKTSVFARVTPDHKLRIIRAFRARGEIIAMTGDGVNDAPSLVAADLGVAMGRIGTEVAKEASDIVLLDDNFGSILAAVEEGRNIYRTIKRVILYLFSTSLGEILAISMALFLGLPLPLLAAQIIWLNLVTDGFLDVALAMEPKEKNLLSGKFEHPNKYLVDKLMVQRMFVMALPMALGSLFLFYQYLPGAGETSLVKAWTISLTALAVFQWLNAFNCRSEKESIFKLKFFSNKFLIGAFIIVISLQLLAIYNPVLQKILRTTALDLNDWLVIVPIAFSIILFEEIRKLIYRKKYVSI